ncbi:MAG: glycosyltransferase family 2 protein [Candidatus Omnitrophica bacterium]|nr:glycosyltransferase family 2 protein [Candidatus Omnitrophota bacterium]
MPKISVIVISLDGSREENVPRLLEDIQSQTVKDQELCVITRVSPNGKARNEGIRKTGGEFLIFLDDDVRLGHAKVFENLLRPFDGNEKIGMTGGSIRIPPDANFLMRRLGSELPRWQVPIVKSPKESDLVTTACCAIPREVLEKVGLFHEGLCRGVDPEFRARLRQAGYKIILMPDTYFFHPLPRTLRGLVSFSLARGMAAGYGARYYPELQYEVPPLGKESWKERRSLLYRSFRKVWSIIQSLLTFKFLRLIADLSYAIGFLAFYLKRLCTHDQEGSHRAKTS